MSTEPKLGDEYLRILHDLERLRHSTANSKVFGANGHDFVLNQVLGGQAVEAFETEYRIKLPHDYRGFLIHVGNGGAGPGYGVFKLGEMDDGHGYNQWKENDGFVGILAEPFPHTQPWNDLSGKPDFDESKANDQDYDYEDAYGAQLDDWEEKHYWNSRHVNGAIPVCHRGCAYRDWLVVTGSEAGHIWCDERADEKGLFPAVVGAGRRSTFIQRYRSWLDDALKTCGLARFENFAR